MKKIRIKTFCLSFFIFIPVAELEAQPEIIGFDSGRWQMENAEVVEQLGRQCLKGTAFLKDVEFENGIIEVDIAITGGRSYPGIIFRNRGQGNFEHFYIRPHRAGLYPDALQYAPSFNGIGSWQLFNGEGYTAPTILPENEWIHVKLVVSGSRALVFIGESEQPGLMINRLQHGISSGSIGINGPLDGSAYFSNFSYTSVNDPVVEPPGQPEPLPGFITDWKLSDPFRFGQLDLETYPTEEFLARLSWQEAKADYTGLVNIGKYYGRSGNEPDCVIARSTILSEKEDTRHFQLGYSDLIAVFMNKKLHFVGNSAYQSRDPSFLGIIGLNDAVYLPLRKGENELLLLVGEAFGGWGFSVRDGNTVILDESIKPAWKTEKVFSIPESVVYDSARNMLYVTNYDQYNQGNPAISQFISKISPDGKVVNLKWIEGLNNPLGMTIYNDKLWISERRSIAEADIETGKIVKHYPVPGSIFLNDIVADESGNLYLSDSRKNVIWKFDGAQVKEWLSGEEINGPNVLYIYDRNLIIGNSGDGKLKKADLITGNIEVLADMGEGFLDGIRMDKQGNYLVSHWRGRLYRVTPEGTVTLLMDTTIPGYFTADFEYIPEKNLLIMPAFFENRVMAYRLSESAK
ncbi:MAG: SMP-30/gluconolactonase/LRE family protein [Bacteroidales bacterium]|nr:MAG: SMP-30/gluconolactonase/LRE family protein [Bacteroidales bacterium]